MNIGAGCHPNKVKVSGPGVAKTGLKAFEPTYFTVDCTEAGQGMTINLTLMTFIFVSIASNMQDFMSL